MPGLLSGIQSVAKLMLCRHSRNGLLSVGEYVALPLMVLASTPFLFRSLGNDQFGLWMLATTIAALGPVAGLGAGPTVIRWVALTISDGTRERAIEVIRTALSLALFSALAMSTILVATAPALAQLAFARMGDPSGVALAISFGAVMLFVQQFDVVFSSALKGAGQFGLVVPVEIANKMLVTGASVGLALLTGDLLAVMAGNLVLFSLGAGAKGLVAARFFGSSVCRPGWFSESFHEIRQFASWQWLQGLSGALFQSVDRLLIGALLGSGPLAAYSICLQLAQQVHALPAAGLSILLPFASSHALDSDGRMFRRIRDAAIIANVCIVMVLAGGLVLAGEWMLKVWMGPTFATTSLSLFFWLVGAHALLGLNIAPHYLLLSRGRARLVAASNLLGGVAASLFAALLIPSHGLVGAAVSRMLYGPSIMANVMALFNFRGEK